MARLEAEGIALVAGLVAKYIASQRKKYGPRATGRTAEQRRAVISLERPATSPPEEELPPNRSE